jgi:hypothetical protein
MIKDKGGSTFYKIILSYSEFRTQRTKEGLRKYEKVLMLKKE